jgi:hypothetical protein
MDPIVSITIHDVVLLVYTHISSIMKVYALYDMPRLVLDAFILPSLHWCSSIRSCVGVGVESILCPWSRDVLEGCMPRGLRLNACKGIVMSWPVGIGLRRLLKRIIVARGSRCVGVLGVAAVGDSLIVAILE